VIDTAYYATVLTPNIDLKYLYYLVKYIGLNHLKDGTSNPSLSRDTFGAQLFPVPPLPEQKAIASILGALDDKIELNRRMNATLEAMARALFQSWFVDFDPVRAKLDGRQPAGLAPATAALFPNSFQDSPLGPIPAGWEVGTLEDLLVLQRGFDLPATKRTNGLYPVIAASGPSGYHNECMVRGPGVTTGRSGVLGNVYFVHDDFWPLNTSLWVKQFKRASPAYAFNVLKTLDFRILNAGSAVPTLNRNHAHRLPVVLPPRCIVDAFSELALALMKRERLNDIASDSLSEIRNSLLPELLSGSVSTTQ
jgi:type I restriction enzyme S subunit